jgi:hypothetical protein
MKYITLTFVALLTLILVLPEPVAAKSFGGSSFRSTSMNSSISRASRAPSYSSITRMKRAADGGSMGLVYTGAYLALVASQASAAEKGTPVRDAHTLSTYGVKADTSMSAEAMALILFAVGMVLITLFFIVGLPMMDHYNDRRWGSRRW